jgi:hypothetical protein
MSFQAYLDTIRAKTGLGPAEFRALAETRGLLDGGVKAGPIITWLAEDYGLGRGHAMALVATFKEAPQGATAGSRDSETATSEAIAAQFAGAKQSWRPTYDGLLDSLKEHGDVSVAPTQSYISLLKNGAKFAIVAVTRDRLDIGIKLSGADATDRLAPAGTWNSMVTHRVKVTSPAEVDAELLAWLRAAYDAA